MTVILVKAAIVQNQWLDNSLGENMNETEFIEYFRSFYDKNHPEAICPELINSGWTDKDIKNCIKVRGRQFEGDSFDREAIRDMLIANYGPKIL